MGSNSHQIEAKLANLVTYGVCIDFYLFWVGFEAKLEPKIHQNGSKIESSWDPQIALKTDFGPPGTTSGVQGPPGCLQGAIFEPFGAHFGIILGPNLEQFGTRAH